MATTPPLRIPSVQEPPPTPRHGAWHDDFVPRYATRSNQRKALHDAEATPETPSKIRGEPSTTTPESNPFHLQHSTHKLSPPPSPQASPEHNVIKRVQVFSPDSPSTSTRSRHTSCSNDPFNHSSHKQTFASDSTTINHSMLPTPVKTPRKKAKSQVNITGRALFQEPPTATNDIMPTPKRSRKSKRHNGFSLESFDSRKEGDTASVQVYTDSRDHVPELDLSAENPFVEHLPEKTASSTMPGSRTSKRRKFGSERKKDEHVERAIQKDDGIVYVFRGKKVFKYFDDRSEDDGTTIDKKDVEVVKNNESDAEAQKLLQPLTRRSIKPRRLFQSKMRQRERETEQAEQEVTDIEEGRNIDHARSAHHPTQHAPVNRRSPRNVTMSSVHTLDRDDAQEKGKKLSGQVSPRPQAVEKSQKGTSFHSWKRVKSRGSSPAVSQSSGRKRNASTFEDGEQSNGARKLRNH